MAGDVSCHLLAARTWILVIRLVNSGDWPGSSHSSSNSTVHDSIPFYYHLWDTEWRIGDTFSVLYVEFKDTYLMEIRGQECESDMVYSSILTPFLYSY